MLKSKPIYVETKINADMEKLWQVTQNPLLHQPWDLRFSQIEYLPKDKEEAPQQFLYKTRIGFGVEIAGKGESVKEISSNGERVSSLKFWSDQSISLIKEGSGYWKYKQKKDGITFLTLYSYKTRFGFLGKVADKFLFRPLMGWATAWSFDNMRLWLEKDIHPQISLQRSIIHFLAVIGLAFVWIYQGVVPKLLFPHSGELEILRETGLFPGFEESIIK